MYSENEKTAFLNGRVTVHVGDITKQNVDAIVNAAKSTLLGGGGVDGAIHDAGGDEILQACREIRRAQFPDGLPTGEAVITTGGRLATRFVIHTVGPIYGRHDGREAELLANCYQNSLRLAVENNLKRIAFPAISTGAYGYPKHEAAAITSEAVQNFLLQYDTLKEVRFVFFGVNDAKTFIKHQKF
jgi:O-acetyl-ADP-ribose deacetylase (regulator of RNase III)